MPILLRLGALLAVSILPSCQALSTAARDPFRSWKVVSVQNGKASWYSVRTNRGTRTASGHRLHDDGATAAHRTLPFGTRVRVTNLETGRSEVVTITDRGPFIRGRVVDVTAGVAKRLGFHGQGVVPVKVEVLQPKRA